MSAPNLETDEGRAAYRKELRSVGRPLRAGGLAMVVAAAVLILMVRQQTPRLGEWAVNLSYLMLAAGWVMVIAAVWMRTRHHKRRLAEGL
ncbi:hypothetical protein [uncultured Brevundimonas sp.]|uniref:hypothetical protein n=1 Tax=uncultured Brevundimonas sp. TaxID=213418 RepID=UPI0025EF474D|nr:hypothetical protein [uncultured Brevundimonas sp.]